MRVAITGASGQLGRFVAAAVAEAHEVVRIDIVPGGDGTLLADVLDREALAAAMAGCDAVIHLAAIDSARPATEDAFFETNVLGCWNVLLTAERLGLRRAVLCSSVAAVGIRAEAPPDQVPIGAEHPLRPVSAYGISKQVGEVVAAAVARRGRMEVVCLRPALVIFPHHVAGWVRAVAGEMASAALPEAIPFTRAYIGAEDAGRAFAAALVAKDVGAEPLFVAAEDTMSLGGEPTPFDLEPTFRALAWRPRDRWADIAAHAVSG